MGLILLDVGQIFLLLFQLLGVVSLSWWLVFVPLAMQLVVVAELYLYFKVTGYLPPFYRRLLEVRGRLRPF